MRSRCSLPVLFSLAILAAILSGCATTPRTIIYRNATYGFSFSLPGSWTGYKVEVANWQGFGTGSEGGAIVQTGPVVVIHHPLWTPSNPRQDIPIMVFTHSQWDGVTRGDFLVSAAPLPPTELGRNADYVFALPPRYNYAFLPGWEEVETIITSKPLTTP